MKLRKILSLVLALVMTATLFGSVVVSATDAPTADMKFVIYEGDKEVEGNLEKGKIYEVGIVLENISTGKLAATQVKLNYNTEVMELVNAGGSAASGADVFVSTVSGGLATFGTPVAAEGVIEYALGPDIFASNPGEIAENGIAVSDPYIVTKIRFKAIADGKLGITLHEDNVLNVAIPEKAEVNFIVPSIRVGEISYTTAAHDFADATETFVVGTKTEAEIISALSEKYTSVDITYKNVEEDASSDKVSAKITNWVAPEGFDAETAGTYTFTATVETPEGIKYTGDAVKVAVNVVIDTLKIQKVAELKDIKARVDAVVVDLLPGAVEVELTGGVKKELAVTWKKGDAAVGAEDKVVAGTTEYVGTLALVDNIENTESLTASVKVIGYAASANVTPSVGALKNVDVAVDVKDVVNAEEGKIVETIVGALPSFVTVTENVGGSEVENYIDVATWELVGYKAEGDTEMSAPKADEDYVIGDKLYFKPTATIGGETVTFPEAYLAEVEVEVPAGKKTVDFGGKVTYATEDIKSDANYSIDDAVAAAGFAAKYADGEDADLSKIVWTSVPDYDNTKEGKYTITGEWFDIYGNSQTLTIEINIVLAGATGIKLYTSATSKNPIGSTGITMETLETRRIYAGLEPIGVTDTITWTIDKTNYAEVSSTSGATATIKAKSIGNVTVTLTATTGSGKSVSIKIVINAKQNINNNYYYGSNNGIGNSLNLLAQDAENLAQQEIAQGSVFTDLVGYEWASTQVETLRLLGVVSGKSNVAYAPADSVTRAEYLAMLVRLFNLPVVGEVKTFTDVPANAWYYDAVSIASSNGIAYGYENGAFDPNAVISRQDMAVFAERAVKAVGLNPMLGLERTFSDQAQISGYALDAVLYMTAIGAINGMGDDSFAPNDTANRAQAAVVIYNLYALKNK